MSKKQSNFKPDERNLGGKNQIFDHMYNHQVTLITMKPIVKSQTKNVEKPIVAKKIPKKNPNEFDEVLESFKRAACVKSNKLSACPETLGLKKMLGKKKNKENDFIGKQHELNLQSQKRRINSLGTMNERQKNCFDPVAKPVFFFRNPDLPKKDISIIPFYTKLGFDPDAKEKSYYNKTFELSKNRPINLQKKPKPEQEKFKKKLDYDEIKKKGNLRYGRINTLGLDKNKKEQDDFIAAPTTKGNSEEDYLELKSKLLQLIVEHRIYKDEVLNDLLERTILLNSHLEQSKIEMIFNFIMEEFEK